MVVAVVEVLMVLSAVFVQVTSIYVNKYLAQSRFSPAICNS